jgi:hypothetical protein
MVMLDKLPVEDAMRNLPLKQIKARIRNRHGKQWRDLSCFRIGDCTYNELSSDWHLFNEFAYAFDMQ